MKTKRLNKKEVALPGKEALLLWRENNHLTQPEAGEMLGLWDSQVCRYERGHMAPSLPTAIRIQKLCGIPLESWS